MDNWLNYPVGHGYITNYQGPGTDTPHFADDVETPFHTPVTALLAGTVTQEDAASWSGQPGGIEVWIQPDDPQYPQYYYYHLDTADVFKGQHVQAGQELGLSGGQNQGGNTPVSPMWSSGPHTHVGFFSSWASTPEGTRPYGPDITSLLQGVTTMPISPLTTTPALNPQSSIFGIDLPNLNWPDLFYRLAFSGIGLLFIVLAISHFLQPEISTVASIAAKAAV